MDVKTKEESPRPLGVIGSLTAGFEMLGRHLWLITLPVLVDLLLWLGPRISIAPLVEQFAAFLTSRSAPDPAMVGQIRQAAHLLEEFGERSNLLALLSALPLLNVPSLLAQHAPGLSSPLGEPLVMLNANVLIVIAWAVILVPIGLVLGFLYLNGVARSVRAMRPQDDEATAVSPSTPAGANADDGPSEVEGPEVSVDDPSVVEEPATDERGQGEEFLGADSDAGKFMRVLLFGAGLLTAGMMLLPVWMLLVGAIVAIAPTLGVLVWSLSIGLSSYFLLHLLFVVPGVLVGGRGLLRSIWESVLLIHTQFPAVLGLLLLVVVIDQGLGFVWSLPSGDSWSLLVGIVGNGCIATGLTAALFVFYQERVGQLFTSRRASVKS